MSTPLPRLEEIIDGSGVPPRIEALLPAGVRHRQLRVRTLLLGMMLTLDDRRPAHLTGVHAALTALTATDQRRLAVTETWAAGPHQLTYRQVERTFTLITRALGKDDPDGTRPPPSPAPWMTCWKPASRPGTRTPQPRSRWTGPTWSLSPARRTAAATTAPTPKRPGDTATPTCPAAKTSQELKCQAATED